MKTNHIIERSIQAGLLSLLALMPFHAFLSVWLGHLTGHQAIIQGWKEVLIAVLATGTAGLVSRQPDRLQRLNRPWVWMVAIFALLATTVSLVTQPGDRTVAFGAKTDLEFLVCAVIAALVADRRLLKPAVLITLGAAAIVGSFGTLELLVLPRDFLTHFGYSAATVQPYLLVSGSEVARFPSTLGGPNQLGTYLILPICLALWLLIQRPWSVRKGSALIALLAVCVLSLVGTYSRGAWVGAIVAVAATVYQLAGRSARRQLRISLGVAIIAGLLLFPTIITRSQTAQYFLLHSSLSTYDQANRSDSEHAQSLLNGATADLKQPFGRGLGTAGPATFHTGTPNIIENQYLQIGYETGLLGLAAFVAILGLLAIRLHHVSTSLGAPLLASLIGVSLTGLVLPAWTDSSTAIIWWTMAGLVAGLATASPPAPIRSQSHV